MNVREYAVLVDWCNNLPSNAVKGEKLTYRSITIEKQELEFFRWLTTFYIVDDVKAKKKNRAAIETVEVDCCTSSWKSRKSASFTTS